MQNQKTILIKPVRFLLSVFAVLLLAWLDGAFPGQAGSFSDVVTAIGTSVMALLAWVAFDNWKDEFVIRKKDRFIEELVKNCYEYVRLFEPCVSQFENIQSHIGHYQDEELNDKYKGIVEYIKRAGSSSGKMLQGDLKEAENILLNMRMLIIMASTTNLILATNFDGQFMKLYVIHDRLTRVAYWIRNDSWYFENPQIKSNLEMIPNMKQEEIAEYRNIIQDLIKLAQAEYKKIF